jgi:hypothetical protein
MFSVDEATAEAIRQAFEERSEVGATSAAAERGRVGSSDHAHAVIAHGVISWGSVRRRREADQSVLAFLACATDARRVAWVRDRRTTSVAPARIRSSGDLRVFPDRLCSHARSMPAAVRALSISSMVDAVRACSAERRKRGLRPVVGSFPA